ncbi:RpiR family transcriptional regulator [Gordoniibacillus kamchatkensis]|uniref:RpiR family transcriptional regulator n=1 Tax=Gordoniibacillus kamchatkensis TaxID=1590651 RepID=A0ABR5ANB3_9BACL|nr:MurR/RpiR family transcriptional regulator [Paenibacillus sp. VKM B-2647]KIL42511.1 RpiR family transcriptional regulator [Paenibacillus sp. VKM B-2647]
MIQGVLSSLEEAMATLKPTERVAARFILDHAETVVGSSVQKVAELAGVSEATIVRLCRSVHCKGFQELKLKIAADLSKSVKPLESYQEIHLDGSIDDLMDSISHNNITSIQDTRTVLSAESVRQAIDTLFSARKIALFGVGASAVIAEDFHQKLLRIDRWCEVGTGFDMQATIAANLTPEDAVFGISYSGQTEDMIRSLTIAKEAGATVIALTRFGSNPVADLADIKLFTSSLEKSIRSGAMASRIAQLNVVDIVYVGIAGKQYERTVKALENTRQAVKSAKRGG